MLNLFTGLPGNGKTLYTLWYVKQWVERENRERVKEGKPEREVFYHGINQLMLPWTKIDPTKWMECPAGAIIVIDEAQFVFEKKPNGAKLPEWYSQLAVHRHLGFDIVLITQNPSLVDNFVRKLVGKHLHIVRTFGMERAVVHEWMSVRESPEKPSNRKDSIQHKWGYPKEVYTYYKSAEQHTVKRNIPMKVWGLGLAVILLAGLVYMVYGNIQKKIHPENTVINTSGQPLNMTSGAASAAPVKVSYKNALEDAKQFMYERTPRLEGLPQTAPRYDENTKPVSVPVPAACIADKIHCRCYSQQATPINTPEVLCRDIVARGFFMEFDPNGNSGKNAVAPVAMNAGAAVLSSKTGDAVKPVARSSNMVVTIGDEDGYGVLGKHRGGAFTTSK